jgi:hypothetical protein
MPSDPEANPTGRTGLPRRPAPWEPAEAHVRWAAAKSVARADAERPLSASALSQSRLALRRMIKWLAKREITSVRQVTSEALRGYNEHLKRYPQRGGGVYSVSTANQDRKHLGNSCAGSVRLVPLTPPTRSRSCRHNKVILHGRSASNARLSLAVSTRASTPMLMPRSQRRPTDHQHRAPRRPVARAVDTSI